MRPTTVWIDAETHLVRKVIEDTPTDQSAGAITRVTTTFEPQANPDLGDTHFRFEVPEQ